MAKKMAKNDPAFPVPARREVLDGGRGWADIPAACGLTKLEWFAGIILQGILANPYRTTFIISELTAMSMDLAEAMLVESEKRK